MSYITEIYAREVLDSKGMPTVEAEVYLESGAYGRAIVPSSLNNEPTSFELRDNDKKRFNGNGALNAVNVINRDIAKILIGEDARDQIKIDKKMISADGTLNKSKFGVNAILAVSIALAKAASDYSALPLYQYLGGVSSSTIPIPLISICTIISSINNIGIVPFGAGSIKDAIRMGNEIYFSLKRLLSSNKIECSTSDDGDIVIDSKKTEEILSLLLTAINNQGYSINKDVKIYIDSKGNNLFDKETKKYNFDGLTLDTDELIQYYQNLVQNYSIVLIENPFSNEDINGYKKLNQKLGKKIDIVSDDLTCGNSKKIDKVISEHLANSIVVKLNQIGTVSEIMDLIIKLKRSSIEPIIGSRINDTEDSFIADLSVSTNSKYIKIGSFLGSERTAKYNQLIRIEDTLSTSAKYYKR